MTNFKNAAMSMATAFTENGAATYKTTQNALLDFFYVAGAARKVEKEDIIKYWDAAIKEDPIGAMKVLFMTRDIHQGRGERKVFRTIWANIENYLTREAILNLSKIIPEFGRWDDLFENPVSLEYALKVMKGEEKADNINLLFKWFPRKGKLFFKGRDYMKMRTGDFRRFLVKNTSVVENLMCKNDWKDIELKKVPSLAAWKYRAAFSRKVARYFEKVATGEVKTTNLTHTSIVADVVSILQEKERIKRGYYTVSEKEKALIEQKSEALNSMWKQLQESFSLGEANSFIPVCDISGSMYTRIGSSGKQEAIHASIALSIALAQKQTGVFKDLIIPFAATPDYIDIAKTNNISEAVMKILSADVWYNTNFIAVFSLILKTAMKHNLKQEDMPTAIVAFSDMEFDQAESEKGSYKTNLDKIKEMYDNAGYELPKLIFWNLAGRTAHTGNFPTISTENNTILYSGYSTKQVEMVMNTPVNATPEELLYTLINTPRLNVISDLLNASVFKK